MAVRWRNSVPSDDPFLEQLYVAVHRLDFAACPLDDNQLQSLLHMQTRAQRLGYQKDFPDAIHRIILPLNPADGDPIGRFLVDYGADEVRLIDIALLPKAQRQGIGTALLQSLLAEAEAADRPLRLSVRAESPALRLYQRLGFRVQSVGVQIEMEHSAGNTKDRRPANLSGTDPVPQREKSEGSMTSYRIEQLIGQQFSVYSEASANLPDIVLASVHHFGAPARNSCALIFEGPLDRPLLQETYRLRAAAKPDAELECDSPEYAVFLVPIGPHDEVMQYEAIFNC